MTVFALPRQRAAAHGRSVQRLVSGTRGRALSVALALVAAAVGVFFLLHDGRGPDGAPTSSVAGQGSRQVSEAAIHDRFVRFADLPRGAPPWRHIPRDVRAGSRVVGRLGGATIFSAPTRDGYWQMFKVGRSGSAGGVSWRVGRTHANGANVIFGGGYVKDGIFSVVSGSTIRFRGAKLFVSYRDGSRQRIKVIWVSRPIGAGFFYSPIPRAHRTDARRAVALELFRGSRLQARKVFAIPQP